MPEIPYTIRHAESSDLEEIASLEAACFPPEEAADREAFARRLGAFPQQFWLLRQDGNLLALVYGMTADQRDLCDEMYETTSLYEKNGGWLMVFGVETHPEHRHKGLASKLLRRVIEDTQKEGRSGIVLTCKAELLPFYARFGFVNEGVSGSVHGGAVWYQMRLDFAEYLRNAILHGEEAEFFQGDRQYLLYGWGQCDGVYLNVADQQGTLLWQTSGSSREECADAFLKIFLA